uniref:Uncharacterized protein n=1 Tax=Arundo donax TaxID=35708 RepID=A0A0A9FHK8_ARUDO
MVYALCRRCGASRR